MSPLYVVFLCVLATVLGQRPKPCCGPSNWQAVMTNTSLINNADVEFYDYYTDYDIKKEALQNMVLKPETLKSYRIVQDHNKGKMYYIMPDGTCRSFPNPLKMFRPCISESAEYLGSSYMGHPDTGLPFDGWRWTDQNVTITITVARDSCIPLIEGVKGLQVDTVFFFSGYTSPLKDRSVFDVPQGC